MPHDTSPITAFTPQRRYAAAIRALRRDIVLLVVVSVLLPGLYRYGQDWVPLSLYTAITTIGMVLFFIGMDVVSVVSNRRQIHAAARSEA